MLVTRTNFDDILKGLSGVKTKALDTETYGLYPYHGDRLFSIIIATAKTEYYFNWNTYDGKLPEDMVLQPKHLGAFNFLLSDDKALWYLHDAKYDRSILRGDGLKILGDCHCTKTQGRVQYNELNSYTLEDLGEKIGHKKDDSVEKYIKAHNLYSKREINGIPTPKRNKRFDLVPFEIMYKYGCQDARVTYELGEHQTEAIEKRARSMPQNRPTLRDVMINERKLDEVLHEMETVGVRVDLKYCQDAMDYYQGIMDGSESKFEELTGKKFVLSSKNLEGVFEDEKEKWKRTPTGQMQIGEDALRLLNHPAAKVIIDYKKALASINFYKNFLFFADNNGDVHTTYNSGGTRTGGRLSSSSPNLQNLKKDKTKEDIEGLFRVRRAITPRPGYFFAMIDADQIEYRLMSDYANCKALNHKIVNEGLDVHTATAQLADIERDPAKTVNFLTLYGGGVPLLAISLYETIGSEDQIKTIYYDMQGWQKIIYKDKKLSKAFQSVTPAIRKHNEPLLLKAKHIQDTIFAAAPELKDFIAGVKETAKTRGFIFNWYGRIAYFPKKFLSYKAPNTLIQGGAGEVIKVGMVDLFDQVLRDFKSRLVMNVHDELVFEIDYAEEHIIPMIVKVLEAVYPHKHVPLTFGVDASTKNLADKEKWTGIGWLHEKTGNSIQGRHGLAGPTETSEQLVRKDSASCEVRDA